jgi:hypothetical protein
VSERDPRARRRRRGLLGLAVAGALLGGAAAGAPASTAQEAGGEQVGDELFGGYELSSRANGIQVTYDMPGVMPISPILQVTVPEALATLSTGPSGYALSSVAFPGPLIADLGAVVALADDNAPEIPGYPLRAEAFFPSGPTEASEGSDGGPVMRSTTEAHATAANAEYSSFDADPLISAGQVISSSRSSIEDGSAVNRARTELTDVRILGGVLAIDSIVTDLVAANDGTGGATDGGTTVSGVRFLGLAATLDERGLVLAEAPPAEPSPAPHDPLGLGQATDGLDQVTGPINELLSEVLDQAVPQLNDLLVDAGIQVRLLEPVEQIGPGSASRSTGGLEVDIVYKGRDQDLLVELIRSIPPEMRQSLGPIPNPVNFLAENHEIDISLGHAAVSSVASPLFVVDIPPFAPAGVAAPTPPASPAVRSGSAGAPGFSTPTPGITGPASAPGSRSTSQAPIELATDPATALTSVGLPALLVLAVLLGSMAFGPASSRLADAVLAPTAGHCPQGLDRPPYPAPRE